MNKLARKLVLSILTVVLTVVALGTTTFAWFTLTNTSVIQSFEAEIVSDTGIEIAIGTGDPMLLEWKNTLTASDIYNYMAITYGVDGFRFTARTSDNGRDMYDLGNVGSGTGFLELPLHFRSQSDFLIRWTNISLTSTPAAYQTGTTFTDSLGTLRTAGSTYTANAVDAFRVSVTGIVDRALGTVGTTVYENPVSATNTVLGGLTGADLTNANGAQNFYFAVNAVHPDGSASVTVVPTITTVPNVLAVELNSGQLLVADAEYYGTVQVRVWFEGWDAEAYNSLLGRMINLSLRFEV
jgi:hypothetical protein